MNDKSNNLNQFLLSARNSDCAFGVCNFNWVALSQPSALTGIGDSANVWVDTGVVSAKFFSQDCLAGDTQSWAVDFSAPFLTSPIVLLTANDIGLITQPSPGDHNCAAVGIARDITPYGFTLTARNSDCSSGKAGFYWVAIGCMRGCG
jgi:hypothetical protein